MNLDDLKPAPYNPRTISPEALAGLRASVRELGDLGGLTSLAKTCKCCGLEKPLEEFARRGIHNGKESRKNICHRCEYERYGAQASKKYREAHREECRRRCREWYAKNRKRAARSPKNYLSCLVCGRAFYAHPGKVRFTCSSKCRSVFETKINICKKCGKEFITRRSQKRKYCSHACYAGDKKGTNLGGDHREKTIKILNERNRNVIFRKKISVALRARAIRLGENYHSSETKEKIGKATRARWGEQKYDIIPILQREAINRINPLRRYGHDFKAAKKCLVKKYKFCAICGKTTGLNAHHILPVERGGKDVCENLVWLCVGHHVRIERDTWALQRVTNNWETTVQAMTQFFESSIEVQLH